MIDIKLDGSHDILFVNGAASMTTELGETLAQRLTIMLKTFMGEWFLNTEYGVPYYQSILGRKGGKDVVDGIFKRLIGDDAEVQSILEFESSLDSQRRYSMTFRVKGAEATTAPITISVGV